MKPGDVVTCSDCGATATARWLSAERPWQEGFPLRLTWSNGPFPRHETARSKPERCLFCHDAALGWPSVLNRPRDGETWTIAGPLKTYEVPAIPGVPILRPAASREGWEEQRAQAPLELSVERGPCADGVRHAVRGTTRPDTTVGFKAPAERSASAENPLARFEELAAAYLAETGETAPDAANSPEHWERWRAWLSKTAPAGRAHVPKPKPSKGQISLL